MERSSEFIADGSKRHAPSRNDTVSKLMATVDALDGADEDLGLPGFTNTGTKSRDADVVYNTGDPMFDAGTKPSSPEDDADRRLFKDLAKKKRSNEKKPSVVPEVPEDSQDLPSQVLPSES